MEYNEIRNWVILFLGIVGAFITLRSYRESLKQRKIDNTFKTLEFLRSHIGNKQIDTFIELFHANNELTGVKSNEFKFTNGNYDTIESMFAEGGCGNGDIHNIIEIFNLLSPTFSKLELDIIWFEYGQLMSKIYQWTKYLEEKEDYKYLNNIDSFYKNFNVFMKKNVSKFLFKPVKYYTYAE